MALFLYKPHFQNQYVLYFTLFIIFIVAYVAMAWYDYYFNCDIVPLKRGTRSFTGLFKPSAHVPDKQENDKDTTIDTKHRYLLISFMHLILIAPLLGYIAIYRKQINPITYPILGILALFTAGYHGDKIFNKLVF